MLGDRGHRATRHTPHAARHPRPTLMPHTLTHALYMQLPGYSTHTRMESIRSNHLVSWARVSPTLAQHTSPTHHAVPSSQLHHPRPAHMPHSHLMHAWHMQLPGPSTHTPGRGYTTLCHGRGCPKGVSLIHTSPTHQPWPHHNTHPRPSHMPHTHLMRAWHMNPPGWHVHTWMGVPSLTPLCVLGGGVSHSHTLTQSPQPMLRPQCTNHDPHMPHPRLTHTQNMQQLGNSTHSHTHGRGYATLCLGQNGRPSLHTNDTCPTPHVMSAPPPTAHDPYS
jgi:hypothetical protein